MLRCARNDAWIDQGSIVRALRAGQLDQVNQVNRARMSGFSTLPTLERGRSSQTSICFGVLTLPIRCLTKAAQRRRIDAAAGSGLHHGDDPFTPFLVRKADHGAILHRLVRPQRVLDLDRNRR